MTIDDPFRSLQGIKEVPGEEINAVSILDLSDMGGSAGGFSVLQWTGSPRGKEDLHQVRGTQTLKYKNTTSRS